MDRPEFREALGTAYAGAGSGDCAAECHALAVSAYLASVGPRRGPLSPPPRRLPRRRAPHPGAAVGWARQDVDLRRTGPTLSLLAWCLHRAGRHEESLAALDEAFALGAGDPLLQFRARLIRQGGSP